ncbi:MAG: imidazole glycerol phosphate synthase subunit HisH [Gammaproteobacteria bacterium]|nr:imidazole glycerol phosphate synthase subunit HisH [Gammaproteobacteria bacterium]
MSTQINTEQKVVIIDTGCANISSVKFAIERIGVAVTVSDEPAVIKAADKVLLPGVGSAFAAMNSIKQKQLVELIQSLTQPVLGICLGMQLMTELSEESPGSHLAIDSNNNVECLNLIPTQIKRMQVGDLVLPHMGWNQIKTENNSPLFDGIEDGTFFYFVHSFCAPLSEYTLVSCEYGQAFSAAIAKDNFYGVQFHPERSGQAGAQLLANFIKM